MSPAVASRRRRFRCGRCPKVFATAGSRNRHEACVHGNRRPFKCDHPLCGKRFRQRCHLDDHMRVHSGDSPFTCNQCGQAFRQKSSVKRHAAVHEPRPFQCTRARCSRAFRTELELHEHTARRHPSAQAATH